MKKLLIGLLTLLMVTACSDLDLLFPGAAEAPPFVVNSENSLNHGILFNKQVGTSELASWQNSGFILGDKQYPMSFELDMALVENKPGDSTLDGIPEDQRDENTNYVTSNAALTYYVGDTSASEQTVLKVYVRGDESEEWVLVGNAPAGEPGTLQTVDLDYINRYVKLSFDSAESFFNISEVNFLIDVCYPFGGCASGGRSVRLLP